MQIDVQHKTSLPNKYVRFIKWKLYRLGRKFKHLHYAEVHLKSEGQQPKAYLVHLRLGVAGHDIIINQKSQDIGKLLQECSRAAHRYLVRRKPSLTNRISQNERN